MKKARMSLKGHAGLFLFSVLASFLFLALALIEPDQLFTSAIVSFASLEVMLLIRSRLAANDSMPS